MQQNEEVFVLNVVLPLLLEPSYHERNTSCLGFVEPLDLWVFIKFGKFCSLCLEIVSCPPRPLWELQVCTDLLDVVSQAALCPLQPPNCSLEPF